MLVIRDAQFEAVSRALDAEFRAKLTRHLQGHAPFRRDSDIQDQISLGMKQAREYGLIREIDVVRFIEAMCVYLGGFTAEPLPKPALAILYGYRTDPEARLNRFIRWCEGACSNCSADAK